MALRTDGEVLAIVAIRAFNERALAMRELAEVEKVRERVLRTLASLDLQCEQAVANYNAANMQD